MYRTADIVLEDDAILHAVSAADLAIHPGDMCVVEYIRVPEFGRVVHLVDHAGDLPAPSLAAAILRRATLQDQSKARENAVVGRMAAKTVHRRIEEQNLSLHVVQIRYSFNRAVLHISYSAEDRLDCTELIRTLGAELHTRIEMRQVGVRDAAKAVGGMGVCGRQVCCRSWMQHFEAVSVKMAKVQRLALNPATIGGVCGRLKCCLKHEFDCYRRQGEVLHPEGACVKCPDGMGRPPGVEAADVQSLSEVKDEAWEKGEGKL
ncbi:MAG: regulatory iron-sulfur-containing complex subunit RicT [bacterium]